jgi:hypothetical protein
MQRHPFGVRYGFGAIEPGEDTSLFQAAQTALARAESLPNFAALYQNADFASIYTNLYNTVLRIADPNDALTIASQADGLRDWAAYLNSVGQSSSTATGSTGADEQTAVSVGWAAITRIQNNRDSLVNYIPADLDNTYNNLLNTLNAIGAGTLTAASQAEGIYAWANYLNSIPMAVDDPIGVGPVEDGTQTGNGVVTTTTTGAGFFDSIQDRIADMFSGLSAKTGLSTRTLEIGAVVIGVGALLVFNSDGGSKRKR